MGAFRLASIIMFAVMCLTRPFSGRVPHPPFTITIVQVPPLCPRPLTASVRHLEGENMSQVIRGLLILSAVLIQFSAIAQCNHDVTAEIVLSYAHDGTVFYAATVTNKSEKAIYLFAPLDFVNYLEVNNCCFMHSTELDCVTASTFSDKFPNLIKVDADTVWYHIYSLSFILFKLVNKMPDCNNGIICINLAYLQEPLNIDVPIDEVIRNVYYSQCVARSEPYPFSIEVPNQAIQRTRGGGLSGSWSGALPASVARVR
jgi:hypothetical protein